MNKTIQLHSSAVSAYNNYKFHVVTTWENGHEEGGRWREKYIDAALSRNGQVMQLITTDPYLAKLNGHEWPAETREQRLAIESEVVPAIIAAYNAAALAANPHRAPQYFTTKTEENVGWSDRQGSRDRQAMLLIYVQNKVYKFIGQPIAGICTIISSDYTKNGKWSHTNYSLRLAKGVKSSSLRQDWDSGLYVNDVTSLQAMAACLGLQGVQMSAVERYLKSHFAGTWKRHVELIEQLNALEDRADGGDTITYEYTKSCNAKRQGFNKLVIDGVVWDEKPNDKVVIIESSHSSGHRGGSTYYKLQISAAALVEELLEYSPYGDGADSLESRGYIYTDEKGWHLAPALEKPAEPETALARALREAQEKRR